MLDKNIITHTTAGDVTFNQVIPPAGSEPALYQATAMSEAVVGRAQFSFQVRNSEKKEHAGTRKATIMLKIPQICTDTDLCLPRLVSTIPISLSVTLPASTPDSLRVMAIEMIRDIVANSSVIEALSSGYVA